jgi:hypothetical protein
MFWFLLVRLILPDGCALVGWGAGGQEGGAVRLQALIQGSSDTEPVPCRTGEVAQKKNSGLGGPPTSQEKWDMLYKVKCSHPSQIFWQCFQMTQRIFLRLQFSQTCKVHQKHDKLKREHMF